MIYEQSRQVLRSRSLCTPFCSKTSSQQSAASCRKLEIKQIQFCLRFQDIKLLFTSKVFRQETRNIYLLHFCVTALITMFWCHSDEENYKYMLDFFFRLLLLHLRLTLLLYIFRKRITICSFRSMRRWDLTFVFIWISPKNQKQEVVYFTLATWMFQQMHLGLPKNLRKKRSHLRSA